MKLKYSIGIATKLIIMVTLVVMSAIGAVIYIATDLFTEDSLTKIQESNKEYASGIAARVQTVVQTSTQKMTVLANIATKSVDKEEAENNIKTTLQADEDLLSFFAYQWNEKEQLVPRFRVTNDVALAQLDLTQDKLENQIYHAVLNAQSKNFDAPIWLNSSPYLKAPVFTISFVSAKKKDALNPRAGRWLFRADLRQDAIVRIFSKKEFLTVFLVDQNGHLMAHSDPEFAKYVVGSSDMSNLPIVQKLKEGNQDNHQMRYESEDGTQYLGAFKKVGIAEVGVIAQVEEAQALATIKRVQYRSGLVMIIVVCLAFFVNFMFSHSITSQLKRLFSATEKIIDGNYDVKLKIESNDEIGALSHAFVNMAGGLREKEKLKTAFNKFHSKEVTQKLLSGEIKLGGEKKNATVFFSDVRGFTAISESMNADQVVTMLNEYMTEMVRIIYKWHGIVDKYIGDAIMAVWGAPETKPDDAYNAVRASLEMRDFLVGFNRERKLKGKAEIKIGIGLHSGEVVSGNIGSEDRLEYTVIGDTVNQASRIEAANKPLHAEFLISEMTYSLVRDRGIEVGPGLKIYAKGKSKPLVVFQVIGYQENGVLKTGLTAEQIEVIKNQSVELEAEEESKIKTGKEKAQEENTNMIHANPAEWFVMPQPGAQPAGPYTPQEIAAHVAHGQVPYNQAQAFRPGDPYATPVAQMPGVDRRNFTNGPQPMQAPPPQIGGYGQGEWYIYGQNGEALGPYALLDLQNAVQMGHLTRTSYVWSEGYEQWIPIFQIPGFDRRMPPPFAPKKVG